MRINPFFSVATASVCVIVGIRAELVYNRQTHTQRPFISSFYAANVLFVLEL